MVYTRAQKACSKGILDEIIKQPLFVEWY